MILKTLKNAKIELDPQRKKNLAFYFMENASFTEDKDTFRLCIKALKELKEVPFIV